MKTRRALLAPLLLALSSGVSPAAERAAVVPSVDLFVPVPPMTFRVDGRTHVAYELHVTNFQLVDVSLDRVRVRTAGGTSLADLRGDDLAARLGRPGLRPGSASPSVVGPGMRAVVYFWMALPEGLATPDAVVHDVEVRVLRPSGAVATMVTGAAVDVAKQSAVVLHPPLSGGPWVAISSPLLLGGHRTTIYTVDGRARIPGRFAIDWIRPGPDGRIESAEPPPPDRNGDGAEVLAVADALVAAAMDDIPENTEKPVALADASGNYVALDLGGGRFAFYEHLKRGTVAVKTGDRVRRGQMIGRLGSSGSTSIGPHLHFHVADAISPLGAEGLPFAFESFDQLGAFGSIEALLAGEKWIVNPGGAAARKAETPAPNAVVRFP